MNIKRKIMIAICLMAAVMSEAVEKHTASINKVTVFTNGAQVERSKSVVLVAGEQVVTFTGFSPYMDKKSLQVKTKGHLTILGVSERTAHPDSAADRTAGAGKNQLLGGRQDSGHTIGKH